jgi:diguanylate cyclase (GGDEF)-like protein
MLSIVISALAFYPLLKIMQLMNSFFIFSEGQLQKESNINVSSLCSELNDGKDVNIFSDIVKNLNKRVGQLELVNKKLRKLSFTDELTNLYNYRAFQELLSKELSRVRRKKTSLSLIMIDLDNFKQFNDCFGHQAGDLYLKETAKVLKGALRTYDIAARYGGDEFVHILPETDEAGVLAVARRIKERFQSMHIGVSNFADFSGRSLSIGIRTVRAEELNFKTKDEIIREADTALYQSKNKGKNAIAIFDSEIEETRMAS